MLVTSRRLQRLFHSTPALRILGLLAVSVPLVWLTEAVAAPKAYVGLFKDNAVAVFDTASNQVTRTIPIATGPHGLVATPDGRWVYASSDGDAVVSVIDTATDEVSKTIDMTEKRLRYSQ